MGSQHERYRVHARVAIRLLRWNTTRGESSLPRAACGVACLPDSGLTRRPALGETESLPQRSFHQMSFASSQPPSVDCHVRTRTRRRTTKAASSRSRRHRDDPHRAVGDSQEARGHRHDLPVRVHRNSERIVYFRAAWKNACKAVGCPGALVHTCAGLPSGRSSARVCRDRLRCRSSDTRRSRLIVANPSWTKPCNGGSGASRYLDGCPSGNTIDGHRHCSPSR